MTNLNHSPQKRAFLKQASTIFAGLTFGLSQIEASVKKIVENMPEIPEGDFYTFEIQEAERENMETMVLYLKHKITQMEAEMYEQIKDTWQDILLNLDGEYGAWTLAKRFGGKYATVYNDKVENQEHSSYIGGYGSDFSKFFLLFRYHQDPRAMSSSLNIQNRFNDLFFEDEDEKALESALFAKALANLIAVDKINETLKRLKVQIRPDMDYIWANSYGSVDFGYINKLSNKNDPQRKLQHHNELEDDVFEGNINEFQSILLRKYYENQNPVRPFEISMQILDKNVRYVQNSWTLREDDNDWFPYFEKAMDLRDNKDIYEQFELEDRILIEEFNPNEMMGSMLVLKASKNPENADIFPDSFYAWVKYKKSHTNYHSIVQIVDGEVNMGKKFDKMMPILVYLQQNMPEASWNDIEMVAKEEIADFYQNKKPILQMITEKWAKIGKKLTGL